uniref:Uncharacterized protein n=1 Tax=Anguilla anguilla TaxID=7936 RepID=A0A0E9S6H5_ANGAN
MLLGLRNLSSDSVVALGLHDLFLFEFPRVSKCLFDGVGYCTH